MGDGDYVWAAADVAMLCRNLVLREERGTLHLFQAADRRWWNGETLLEGAPTHFGPVRLHARGGEVRLEASWREKPTRIILHKPEGVPGCLKVDALEVRGDGRALELAP